MTKNHEHPLSVRKDAYGKVEIYCADPECDWTADYNPDLATHRETFGEAVKKLLVPKI